MASYYGPGLAASALTNAIGSVFKGLNEGEDARTKREFLEAEIAKMRRDPVTTLGRFAFRQNPDGTMTQVAETPENPQALAQAGHFRVLTDKAREEMQLGRDFRPQLQQLYDEMVQGGVPPWYARGIMFAQTPAQLEQVLARIGPQLFKVKPEPKTSKDLMRLLEDPSVTPEDKARYKAILDRFTKEEETKSGRIFDRQAKLSEIGVVGRMYGTELNRINVNYDQYTNALIPLIRDMKRLVEEGRILGMTTSPGVVNKISNMVREGVMPTGDPKAQWLRAFASLDARFGTVAKSIEQITGNRMAIAQMIRALGFHPKVSDPYDVQSRVVRELDAASRNLGASLKEDAARVTRQYGGALSQAGVPSLIDKIPREFETPRDVLVRDKATGKPGTLTLDPGEQVDTSKYEVLQ